VQVLDYFLGCKHPDANGPQGLLLATVDEVFWVARDEQITTCMNVVLKVLDVFLLIRCEVLRGRKENVTQEIALWYRTR